MRPASLLVSPLASKNGYCLTVVTPTEFLLEFLQCLTFIIKGFTVFLAWIGRRPLLLTNCWAIRHKWEVISGDRRASVENGSVDSGVHIKLVKCNCTDGAFRTPLVTNAPKLRLTMVSDDSRAGMGTS